MPLQKLALRAGLNREGTNYSNTGGWYDGDKIRFRSGQAEKIGGWTQYNYNQYLGVCRSIWVWLDGDAGAGSLYVGVGTNVKYYILFGGVYNDITPIYQTNTLTNPFTTVAGSKTVTVTDATYQPTAGDYVYFSGASSVGGVLVSGDYLITNIVNSTQYTIVAAQTASTGATGGGTVTAQYEYPSGNTVFTIGTGWGAGPYGGALPVVSSLLGNNPFSISAGSNVVTVTQTAHGMTTGQYVSFSGATDMASVPTIYGFTPATYNISATNGAGMSGLTYDTLTSNYLNSQFQITYVNANTYTITVQKTVLSPMVGGGSNVVATEQSGSRGWGTAYSSGIGSQLRLWSNDNFGFDLVIAPRGGPVFYWQDANTVNTRAKYLKDLANTTTQFSDASTFGSGATSITVSATAAVNIFPYMYITGNNLPANTQVATTYITGSTTVPITTTTSGVSSSTYNFSYAGAYVPSATYQVITSEVQEFVICFGANNYYPGVPSGTAPSTFNPMLVRWSDQANAYQWVPQLTNQSGEYTLSNGSFIMGARATRQEILVWTDSAIYSMQYLGAPYVWGFQILMDNISIMGPNSMITINNVTYWMGRDRFYMYDGTVKTLPCTLKQYIYADINQDQSYQVFAGSNEGYNEVWWFYVSLSSGNTVVDKYVIYNFLENVWSYGTMSRTAWLETGTQPFPIAADYNNRLLNHEDGVDDNSTSSTQPIYAYVQSSDFEISQADAGQHFGFVWRMLPDVNFNGSTTNNPEVTIQLLPAQNSGSPYGNADSPAVTSAQNYTNLPEYTVQLYTGQVYTRLRGRQMAFRISSSGIGTTWQLGVTRFDIRPDGRR
jgi:hypothetical protein